MSVTGEMALQDEASNSETKCYLVKIIWITTAVVAKILGLTFAQVLFTDHVTVRIDLDSEITACP